MTGKSTRSLSVYSIFALILMADGVAKADDMVVKAYKSTYPDSHVNCMQCHTGIIFGVKWNAYGQKLKTMINDSGIGNKPAANDLAKIQQLLKKMGKVEDFKASSQN